MTQDYILARLLANNAQWAEDVEKAEPGFLADLAKQQTPKGRSINSGPPSTTINETTTITNDEMSPLGTTFLNLLENNLYVCLFRSTHRLTVLQRY